MLVTACAEVAHLGGNAEQEPELLDAATGARQVTAPVTRTGRLDEDFETSQSGRLNAVAEQHPLAARKPFDRRNEPDHELGVGLQRLARPTRVVRH